MEPFSPDDPLHQLLDKSRPVKVRTDFTQNVLRAIRQEPQRAGWWFRVQEWLAGSSYRPGYALAVMALFLFAVAGLFLSQNSGQGDQPALVQAAPALVTPELEDSLPSAQDETLDSVVASDLDSMDQLSILLAQQDTSSLTDSEIAMLLY